MAINSGFSHEKWWFSIATLNYQRVIHQQKLVFFGSSPTKMGPAKRSTRPVCFLKWWSNRVQHGVPATEKSKSTKIRHPPTSNYRSIIYIYNIATLNLSSASYKPAEPSIQTQPQPMSRLAIGVCTCQLLGQLLWKFGLANFRWLCKNGQLGSIWGTTKIMINYLVIYTQIYII